MLRILPTSLSLQRRIQPQLVRSLFVAMTNLSVLCEWGRLLRRPMGRSCGSSAVPRSLSSLRQAYVKLSASHSASNRHSIVAALRSLRKTGLLRPQNCAISWVIGCRTRTSLASKKRPSAIVIRAGLSPDQLNLSSLSNNT